jgi:hypothetical protein
MTSGQSLYDFITGLNGGATIDIDLLTILVNTAKAIVEEERDWMVLRKIDTSKTVTTANTWQTAIDLSTITDFSQFNVNQDGIAVKLFDGDNRIQHYFLKPFDERLEYKDSSNTCVYDENTKLLYLNGLVPFSGTLYIPYISSTPDIDLSVATDVWTVFPSRFLPILGYYAIGIHMSGVDYDTITARMSPANVETMRVLRNAMNDWDNKKQLSAIQSNDPSEYNGGYPRLGTVDRYNTQ